MLKFVPNILTMGRFVLTIIFLIMVLYAPAVDYRAGFLNIAFVLFVVAGLTDIVDGHVARKFDITSKFGRIMDPLADKVLVVGSFICFAIIGQPVLFELSRGWLLLIQWGTVVILISRELYVTIIRQIAESKGISFGATFSGKAKMFLQSFTIGTVIIKMAHAPEAQWANWFTSLVYILMLTATVVSGVRAGMRSNRNNKP